MPPLEERQASIQRVLDDPPPTHADGIMSHAPTGVWQTERSAYEFLAQCAVQGIATLETGCGISTVLLGLWGARHTCITPSADEVERTQAYCESREISLENVEFLIGPSDEILPSLSSSHQLDLVLIDGGHAFPLPIIDWYYAASRLRAGGILVVDDLQLAPVSEALIHFP